MGLVLLLFLLGHQLFNRQFFEAFADEDLLGADREWFTMDSLRGWESIYGPLLGQFGPPLYSFLDCLG